MVTPDKKLVWETEGLINTFKMFYYPANYPGVNALSINIYNETLEPENTFITTIPTMAGTQSSQQTTPTSTTSSSSPTNS